MSPSIFAGVDRASQEFDDRSAEEGPDGESDELEAIVYK